MCGICAVIEKNNSLKDDKFNNVFDLKFINNRGPDFKNNTLTSINGNTIKMHGTVLHMQGEFTPQPLIDNDGNILLWNGEIFNGLNLQNIENDAAALMKIFSNFSKDIEFLDIIGRLQGPWAFIYLQKTRSKLWFGRDILGRRSLLYSESSDFLTFSSVSISHTVNFTEIPSFGIFCLDLSLNVEKPKLFPWILNAEKNELFCDPSIFRDSSFKFELASSGITSQIEKIDAILPNYDENIYLQKGIEIPMNYKDMEAYFLNYKHLVEEFKIVLSDSIRLRVIKKQPFCKICKPNKLTDCQKNGHAKVAILFSGGLDSLVIAALTHNYIPAEESIDLINVAFSQDTNFLVPDRQTGIESYMQLQKIYPTRRFNFVKVDVSLNDLQAFRYSTICHLVKPLKTVLDDSISCAIWFAARGEGTIDNDIEYTSNAQVILTGIGADEQLGGYSRHRMKFQNGNWINLIDEIQMEIRRISARNLGRDDRIITDHGKEARFPFLDENVVSFLNAIPIWIKANLYLPRGIGEKLLLRLLAINLGLENCSLFMKRAIQFGSRIAKLESKNEKSSDICDRLK